MELQGPIMTQPGAGAVPLGCPPGLEYLTQVDHLIVKGKVELLEAFTGDLVPSVSSIIFVTLQIFFTLTRAFSTLKAPTGLHYQCFYTSHAVYQSSVHRFLSVRAHEKSLSKRRRR